MAWCRRATSHYLSQCWPRSLSPYGVSRPQWVNALPPLRCGSIFKSAMRTWSQIAVMWMPQKTFHNKSTLLGAVRQKAITRADVCPYQCRHMASLDHNKLTNTTPTDFARFRWPLRKMMYGYRQVSIWCWWPNVKTFEEYILNGRVRTNLGLILLTWLNFNPSMDK